MRYWFDATYYKPGGPVLVLCSGEDDGEDRLPYLQKGMARVFGKEKWELTSSRYPLPAFEGHRRHWSGVRT